MTHLTLSDSAKLLSALDNEQETLQKRANMLSREQVGLHQRFLVNMQKLSQEHERVIDRLSDVDKMLAMAYSERSCCLTY